MSLIYSIALGQHHIAPYLGEMCPPILACFHDPDNRVRYFACESMYNVAKVRVFETFSKPKALACRQTQRAVRGPCLFLTFCILLAPGRQGRDPSLL